MKRSKNVTKKEIIIWAATALFLLLAAVMHLTFTGRGYGSFTVTASRAAETEQTSLIDLNTADEALLQQLPGIGPALAARIVAYREANGAFGSAEELTRVSGIGTQTLDEILPYVTVGSTP